MTAEEQRLIGGLAAQIEGLGDYLNQSRAELREDIKGIYSRLDKLSVEGCAKGQQHTIDIEALKRQPEKITSIGAAIASIFAAIGAIVAVIWGIK